MVPGASADPGEDGGSSRLRFENPWRSVRSCHPALLSDAKEVCTRTADGVIEVSLGVEI